MSLVEVLLREKRKFSFYSNVLSNKIFSRIPIWFGRVWCWILDMTNDSNCIIDVLNLVILPINSLFFLGQSLASRMGPWRKRAALCWKWSHQDEQRGHRRHFETQTGIQWGRRKAIYQTHVRFDWTQFYVPVATLVHTRK